MCSFINEECFIGDGIEKIDVVGDNKDGALVITKEVAYKKFGTGVKVISGFVEE